jgi:hypothetical protein
LSTEKDASLSDKYSMRELRQILEVLGTAVYYHVTFATRVPSILQQGLVAGKIRNWNNAFGNKQGSTAHIYLFDDFTSAVRWAATMEWEFDKPVEILVIENPPGLIQPDDHIQMQLNGYGALTTDEVIPPECIRRAISLTSEMKKEVAQTQKATIPESMSAYDTYRSWWNPVTREFVHIIGDMSLTHATKVQREPDRFGVDPDDVAKAPDRKEVGNGVFEDYLKGLACDKGWIRVFSSHRNNPEQGMNLEGNDMDRIRRLAQAMFRHTRGELQMLALRHRQPDGNHIEYVMATPDAVKAYIREGDLPEPRRA